LFLLMIIKSLGMKWATHRVACKCDGQGSGERLMRGLIGLLGLLAALVVTGLLLRQQLKAVQTPLPALQTPTLPGQSTAANGLATAPLAPASFPQQYKKALEGALQARPVADD
jgi:hypothetical protein